MDKCKEIPLVFVPPAKQQPSPDPVVGLPKGERNLLPDNSELTTRLAEKAFDMIGAGNFSVSAVLSVDCPESLRNYGLLQSILLMAYREGQQSRRSE